MANRNIALLGREIVANGEGMITAFEKDNERASLLKAT